MDRLRPRNRAIFSGFTNAEVEKMEKLLRESSQGRSFDREFYQKLTASFNRSAGRAGKPTVKFTEIQSWFETRIQDLPQVPDNELESPQGLQCKKEEIIRDPSQLEFEARSSKDRAWYDVEAFLAHRFDGTGEAEVRVRFVGFGAAEDEWVNIKESVRERSVPFENTECSYLKVGDPVLCFQERRDQAIYFDAHILEIQRRMHDIRGCRCLILVRYDHDNTETLIPRLKPLAAKSLGSNLTVVLTCRGSSSYERVRLRRLCRRPRA